MNYLQLPTSEDEGEKGGWAGIRATIVGKIPARFPARRTGPGSETRSNPALLPPQSKIADANVGKKARPRYLQPKSRHWLPLRNELPATANLLVKLYWYDIKTSISTKIPDNPLYYVSIGRKYNIVHSQLTLQCSDLFEHLFMNHVRENSFCHCNNTSVESCYHYFFHCPLYINQRFKMINKITTLCPNVHIATDLLLYGSKEYDSETNAKNFKIVQTYLRDSERFS